MIYLLFLINNAIIINAYGGGSVNWEDSSEVEFSDSQSKLSQASVDYYHALKSGKGKTPAEREALWDKFVGPVEKKAEESQSKIFQNQRKSPFASPKPELSGNPEAPVNAGPQQPTDTHVDRPVYELDGTNIPKELSFSKDSGDETQPLASPSASPGVQSKVKKKKKSLLNPKVSDPHQSVDDSIKIYQ